MSTKPASKTLAKKAPKPVQKNPDKFWVFQVDAGHDLATEPLGPFDSEAAAMVGLEQAIEEEKNYGDSRYSDVDYPIVVLKEVAKGYPKVSVSVELLAEKPKR